jgi:polycystin 1L2
MLFKAFKTGSVCNFIMSVEEKLGPLTYLRIWHDNSGRGSFKSWYLNTVTIVDLHTNERLTFQLFFFT